MVQQLQVECRQVDVAAVGRQCGQLPWQGQNQTLMAQPDQHTLELRLTELVSDFRGQVSVGQEIAAAEGAQHDQGVDHGFGSRAVIPQQSGIHERGG